MRRLESSSGGMAQKEGFNFHDADGLSHETLPRSRKEEVDAPSRGEFVGKKPRVTDTATWLYAESHRLVWKGGTHSDLSEIVKNTSAYLFQSVLRHPVMSGHHLFPFFFPCCAFSALPRDTNPRPPLRFPRPLPSVVIKTFFFLAFSLFVLLLPAASLRSRR